MDPNQFNTYYSLLSNSDYPPQNLNPTISLSPRAPNPYTSQNNEFQVPYFPQPPFPFSNFPSPHTGNMATNPFQSQIPTSSSESESICSNRTMINTFGAYSSSSNPETLAEDRAAERVGEDLGVTSPVRPKGNKLFQKKSRGKATTSHNHVLDEELDIFNTNEKERLKYLREMKELMEIDMSMNVLSADMSKMSKDQHATYVKLLGKIKDKYNK